jgi:hypothetical protein
MPKKDQPLDPYRRVRKPMPPPERVERDRRRDIDEREARKELDKGKGRRRKR